MPLPLGEPLRPPLPLPLPLPLALDVARAPEGDCVADPVGDGVALPGSTEAVTLPPLRVEGETEGEKLVLPGGLPVPEGGREPLLEPLRPPLREPEAQAEGEGEAPYEGGPLRLPPPQLGVP